MNRSARFVALAVEHGMLTSDDGARLLEAAERQDKQPDDLARERGQLSAIQVDVLQALLDPRGTVPGFELHEPLGYGGFGIVFRASQSRMNREVALKVVRLAQIDNADAIRRFEQEAQLIGRLRHPNIVTAYDYGTHAGRMYFSMELVPGQDLADRIRQLGRLDERETWGIIRQVAMALACAEEEGIIHRDIKPGNILLTRAPVGFPIDPGLQMVKVADFGLATISHGQGTEGDVTATHAVTGTPLYAAPEQLSGRPVGTPADIYGLGVTAFHMLTGKPPFEQEQAMQVVVRKMTGDDTWLESMPPDVPSASRRLIREMTVHDPDDRIADPATLLARIDEVFGPSSRGEDESVLPAVGKAGQTGAESGSQGNRRWALLAAVVALVLTSTLVALWFASGSPDRTARRDPTGEAQLRLSDAPVIWLFDGLSVAAVGSRQRGRWELARDREGGVVLAGRGSKAFPLLDTDSQPLNYFRFSAGFQLHEARTIDFIFGRVHAVRVENGRVTLGRRSSPNSEFAATSDSLPLPGIDADDWGYFEIAIERHTSHWRAYLGGQPIGSIRAESEPGPSQIELVTTGGPAFFESIRVRKLM